MDHSLINNFTVRCSERPAADAKLSAARPCTRYTLMWISYPENCILALIICILTDYELDCSLISDDSFVPVSYTDTGTNTWKLGSCQDNTIGICLGCRNVTLCLPYEM